jgi:signal-transduction protein with cAMP-binding, CBS, and nucleotidyltransferase domain
MKTAEDILKQKGGDIICVSEDTVIIDALKKMIENKIGAVVVKRDEKLLGIWTERDLMRNTVIDGFDPKTAKVGEYMTNGLRYAPASDSVYMLMDKFLGMRLRHLVIEKDGIFIGLLTPGDVIKAILHSKTKELREKNAELSWEYYEDWKWKKKFDIKVETPGQPVREL